MSVCHKRTASWMVMLMMSSEDPHTGTYHLSEPTGIHHEMIETSIETKPNINKVLD